MAVFLLFAFLPERPAIRLFVNSDALFMPSLYQDLFVHRTGIPVWHLNGAPNFFPEMLLYFPLMALMGSTTLGIVAYGLVQLLLIMYLIDRVLMLADIKISTHARYLVLLSYVMIPLSAVLNEGHLIPSQLLLGGYHGGFFINSLLATLLAFSYLQKGGGRKLIWLGILILVAAISDKLFIMGFVAPIMLYAMLHLLRKGKKGPWLALMAVAAGTTLLALFTYRMMNFLGAIEMISTGGKMFQWQQIPEAWGNFLHHMRSVIIDYPTQRILVLATGLFMLGAPLFLILKLKSYVKGRLDQDQERSFAWILFLTFFVYLILFTPIINGYYVGRAVIRYNYAALVMGTGGFVYLSFAQLPAMALPAWLKGYFTSFCSVLLLITLLIPGIKEQAFKGFRSYLDHYPEKVQILDELKSEHGLKYGLAGYWQAKYSTMFSREGLRLYSASNGSFQPSYHVTNENWFHDGGKGEHANPTFNFLETSSFKDTRKLKELFGEQIDTLYQDKDMLVIKVPDFKLRREDREIYLLDP